MITGITIGEYLRILFPILWILTDIDIDIPNIIKKSDCQFGQDNEVLNIF